MFKKFDSLENAYRQQHIERCAALSNPDWVALEKIHGSNYSWWTDGVEVDRAKRSGVIKPEEKFFNHLAVDYTKQILKLHELLTEHFRGPIQIGVYGELYGPGVQSGVYYDYKVNFVAYDIYVKDMNTDLGPEWYLNWDAVKKFCALADIPVVAEMGRGTLEDMLKLPVRFDSVLGGKEDNLAEGLVIKQATNEQYPGQKRLVIKNKAPEFSEKKNKKAKTPHKMDPKLEPLFQQFTCYLTENRLRNVISKVGEVTQKDFGKLSGLLMQDAKEEFDRDEFQMPKDDWAGIYSYANKVSMEIVRHNWLNILDGNF